MVHFNRFIRTSQYGSNCSVKNQPEAINCFSLHTCHWKTSWDNEAKLQFFPLNTAQRCGVWHVGVEHRVISPWWPLATVEKHEATGGHQNMRENQHDSMLMLELGQQKWGTVQLPILTISQPNIPNDLYDLYNSLIWAKSITNSSIQCERTGSCSSCIFVIPCPHVSLVSPPLVQGALDSQHGSLSESQMRKCQPGCKTSKHIRNIQRHLTTGEIIRTILKHPLAHTISRAGSCRAHDLQRLLHLCAKYRWISSTDWGPSKYPTTLQI